ncbi:hypothetical protein ACH5RR_003738 [Cinchona calisaya]|uniref:Uncharacterized protein n=1 Tax=Cinchona calisaya TaxID=153742 RepID=A0ABD3AVM8_9GENT
MAENPTPENPTPEETVVVPIDENTAPAETVVVPITEEKNEEVKDNNEVKEQPKEVVHATTMTTKTVNMKHIMLPLTMLSFLLSLPILFSIIWLLYMRQYDCENLLDLPKLQVGIVIGLTIVFFTSNSVAKFHSRFPMLGLLVVIVPLILMLIVGIGLVGAFDMETRNIPGTPRWIKMEVDDDYNWNDIKSCIYGTTTCKELVIRSYTTKTQDFRSSKLSPIEEQIERPNFQHENGNKLKLGK